MRKTIAACAITALAVGGASATAQSLITSKDIADGTVQNRDIHDGAISYSRLTPGLRALVDRAGQPGKDGVNGTDGARGASGVNGKDGAKGEKGDKGDKGDKGEKGDTGATGSQGPQGDPGEDAAAQDVTSLSGDFRATNPSVRMTPDGVVAGPYADGGAAGGSLEYDGLNGHKLGDITSLFYTARYSTGDNNDVGVPYLRVFLNPDANGDAQDDVIFSPNTQSEKQTAQDVFHHWVVTDGSVRFDDDAGSGPDVTWAEFIKDHADDEIAGIYITTGWSAGADLTSTIRTLGVNGTIFRFGS